MPAKALHLCIGAALKASYGTLRSERELERWKLMLQSGIVFIAGLDNDMPSRQNRGRCPLCHLQSSAP